MTLTVRAVFWVIAYLGAVLSPLVFAVIGASQPDHGFWTDFSVALGFVGLAMMGLEFALVAHFRPLAAPFGQDALLQFHRQIGYAGLAFVLIHFAISAQWSELTFCQRARRAAAGVVRDGGAAGSDRADHQLGLAAQAAAVLRGVARRSHTVLALVLVGGALLHVFFVDEYVSSLWKQILWGLMSAAFVGLLVWVRLVEPRRALAHPWRLAHVVAERGAITTLVLDPPPAAKFRFAAWAVRVVRDRPVAVLDHPASVLVRFERRARGGRARGQGAGRLHVCGSASSSPARPCMSTVRTASSRSIRTRARRSD